MACLKEKRSLYLALLQVGTTDLSDEDAELMHRLALDEDIQKLLDNAIGCGGRG